jgi:hypothetical protein
MPTRGESYYQDSRWRVFIREIQGGRFLPSRSLRFVSMIFSDEYFFSVFLNLTQKLSKFVIDQRRIAQARPLFCSLDSHEKTRPRTDSRETGAQIAPLLRRTTSLNSVGMVVVDSVSL